MKKALFNIVVYALLLWSLLTGVYAVLPQDVKDLIPQFNGLTAIISGGSAALIGSGGLVFKTWLAKAQTESNDKYKDVVEKFLMITDKYGELANQYKRLESVLHESTQKYAERIKTLETLLKVDLQAKLSNKLIDEEVRRLLEGVLDEKETTL